MLITGQVSTAPVYRPQAVEFTQGAFPTGLVCASATVPDSDVGSMFFWFKNIDLAFNSYQVIWVVDPDNRYDSYFDIYSSGSEAEIADVDENNFLYADSDHDNPFAAGWHWYLWSYESSQVAGQKRMKIILDGVDVTNFVSDFGSDPFTIGINGLPVYFMDDNDSDSVVGIISDYWMSFDTSLFDISGNITLATQERFVKNGKPRNPSGFPGTPAYLFSGNASTWPVNQGSGGAVTLYGGPIVTVAGPAG